ncbi:MAG: HD domain-containing protein [Clostridia bacterium]|nr:HD domain-containing protein [Clostridia bacterium]
MKIDIEKAQNEFIKYTNKFDLQNEPIKRKQEHSFRVMKISKQIAEGLKLNQEDIEVATLIGLLHDIARFNQYTEYHTFSDSESFDHGDYAEKLLEKELSKYVETDEYNRIIKKAIKNHNKYQIEEGLTEKEILFAKIIRDADKIDILYESVDIFWKDRENEVEETKITENTIKQFMKKGLIKKSKNNQKAEQIVVVIAFIFDINFKESFEIINQEDYINKIMNRYNLKDEKSRKEFKEIQVKANEYIKSKI